MDVDFLLRSDHACLEYNVGLHEPILIYSLIEVLSIIDYQPPKLPSSADQLRSIQNSRDRRLGEKERTATPAAL